MSVQGPQQRFLLTELLKDYNPMERPVANDSQALTVQFSFILIQVMDVVRMAEMFSAEYLEMFVTFTHNHKCEHVLTLVETPHTDVQSRDGQFDKCGK